MSEVEILQNLSTLGVTVEDISPADMLSAATNPKSLVEKLHLDKAIEIAKPLVEKLKFDNIMHTPISELRHNFEVLEEKVHGSEFFSN